MQHGKLHLLAVGKFQRVVMDVWVVEIDLPEDSHCRRLGFDARQLGYIIVETGAVGFDWLRESDLGARFDANRAIGIIDTGKAARTGAEIGDDQLVVESRVAGFYALKTIITDDTNSRVKRLPPVCVDF